MENPAVTEDGPARPRLWSPTEDSAPLPPSVAEKPPKRSRAKPTPTAALPKPEEILPARPRYSPTIKELPTDDRPRERLAAYGPQALTTAELLAILIRVGNAQRSAVSLSEHLLTHFGNIYEVACAPVEALAKVHGIGTAKAAQIKAAIEFGNRVALFSADARPSITGPRDIANLLMPELRHLKKETLISCKVSVTERTCRFEVVAREI